MYPHQQPDERLRINAMVTAMMEVMKSTRPKYKIAMITPIAIIREPRAALPVRLGCAVERLVMAPRRKTTLPRM